MSSLNNVEFVSASAGSGKTFTLTEKMAELVKGGLKPENFILTTYTRAAASEFKEKVRSKFYERRLSVTGLDNAVVGTIHSVAHQFLMQYWYLLGISPEISILTDEDKSFYMNQTLLQCVDKSDLAFFNSLVSRFNITKKNGKYTVQDYDFWKIDLDRLIAAAVNFNITDLSDHSKASKEMLAELCDMAESDEKRLYFPLPEREYVMGCLNSVYSSLEQLKDNPTNQNKKMTVKNHISSLTTAASDEDYACCLIACSKDLVKNVLNTNTLNTANQGEEAFFKEVQENAYRMKEIYCMLEMYVERIFSIVKVWVKKYELYKKQNQMLDYSDLEKYFMQLLNIKEVQEDIAAKYKVVLVDEFQDCSPIQVAIFRKLASLVEKNIWVGDLKQSIYGFRGTDVELIEDVLKEMPLNKKSILDTSWRSAAPLVEFANNVFTYAFGIHNNMPEESVKLKVADKNKYLAGELAHWHICAGKADEIHDVLIGKVTALRNEKGLNWKDIAILSRENYEARKVAQALKSLGIPVNVLSEDSAEKSVLDTVVQSLLSIAIDSNNELSKAVIMQYLKGEDLKNLMENPQERESALIERIIAMAGKYIKQPVSDFVESMFVELSVHDLLVASGLGNSREVYSALQWYEKKAKEYEERCTNMSLASSLLGFVECMKVEGGSNPADDEGVTVTTYHKSKGLEWPAVVLWDLHKDYLKYDNRVITGVNVVKSNDKYEPRLLPSFICNILKNDGEDLFAENSVYQYFHNKTLKESVRLLYVGVTRAKQYLVTTTVDTPKSKRGLEWFASAFNSTVLVDEKLACIPVEECCLTGCEEFKQDGEKVEVLAVPESKLCYTPLYNQPSKLQYNGNVEVCELVEFGERVHVKGESNKVGDCIHHFMQLYGADMEKNRTLLAKLADSYNVAVDSYKCVSNAEAFFHKMEQLYGSGEALRETPFSFVTKEGQIVNGEIDLVWSTAEGDVIVDYKSFPGNISDLLDQEGSHWVGKYAGQLEAYMNALKLSGRNVRAIWICYISLGVMVEVKIGY